MTISHKQSETPDAKLHNQDIPFEEGFFLTPDKLNDIVKSIDDNFQSNKVSLYLFISVEYARIRDRKIVENKSFETIEELFKDRNTTNRAIKNIRLSARSQNLQDLSNPNNIDCTIDYGSQDSIPLNKKGGFLRIALKVSGTDARWMSQLSNEVTEEIKRTLMNPYFSKFIGLTSSLKTLLLFLAISFHIFFLLAWGFQIEALTSGINDLEEASQKLEILYKNSESISQESEKVDFLFQERVLLNEIKALSETRSPAKRIVRIKWKNVFRIGIFLIISLISIVSFSSLYPLENFMWGDYETHYKNLKQFREFLLIGIVAAVVINLATGFF